MNVLIIGGGGFVGTAVAELFVAQKHKVFVVSRGSKPPMAGTTPLTADRKDASAFAAAIKGKTFEVAIDLTAYQAPDVQAVMPSLSKAAGHYVLISTDFVYATDIEQFPITEKAPKDPNSGYGIGKLACEGLALESMPTTVLRPPHIIGAGKELGTGTVQGRDKNLLRSMRAGTGLTMIAEGEMLIQPVWHRQIAEAIETIAGNPACCGQIMNMPGAEAVTTRRYYQLVADRLGVPLKYDSTPVEEYRKNHPDKRAFARHRVYDTSKLRNLAGYVARPQLKEAIDETVTWMEKNC